MQYNIEYDVPVRPMQIEHINLISLQRRELFRKVLADTLPRVFDGSGRVELRFHDQAAGLPIELQRHEITAEWLWE